MMARGRVRDGTLLPGTAGHLLAMLKGLTLMCGIAGLAGPDAAAHRETVAAMGKAQAHRGPDGTRSIVSDDQRAALAMNTLRIVNPNVPLGPYADPATGLLLAFNGEIYNYRSVAASQRIALEAGETDAHLLLRAWAQDGPSCLEAMDGPSASAKVPYGTMQPCPALEWACR
jgi:asparagine synthase (glutamine-hydrolysing)